MKPGVLQVSHLLAGWGQRCRMSCTWRSDEAQGAACLAPVGRMNPLAWTSGALIFHFYGEQRDHHKASPEWLVQCLAQPILLRYLDKRGANFPFLWRATRSSQSISGMVGSCLAPSVLLRYFDKGALTFHFVGKQRNHHKASKPGDPVPNPKPQ